MTLHRKTLLFIGLGILTAVLLVYVSSRMILLDGFIKLEEHDTRQNLQRALNLITNKMSALKATGLDWANWDDTYTFVQDGNKAYIESNMADATFITNAVNFMIFVNSEGRVVYAKGFDLRQHEAAPLPLGLYQHLVRSDPLLQYTQPSGAINKDGLNGFIMLAEGPAFIFAAPILTSERAAPVKGTFVWGRYIYPEEMQQFAAASQLALTLFPLTDQQLPGDVQAARSLLSPQAPLVVQSQDEQKIAGYALLQDIYGQPALILRAEMPRAIYAQAGATLSYFLIAFIAIGILFIGVAMLLLEKLVLARLIRLSTSVANVERTDDLSTPIAVTGNDEIAALASGVKNMLGALAQSRQKLQDANDDLEMRVQQRTAELSQTNVRLQQEIAEREQAQAKLATARDQALEALRLKTQILANISHDARTPLNVITLRAELIQKGRHGTITDAQRTALDSIRTNAQQLTVFFNNLLSEAQLNASTMKLANVEFAPVSLLVDVVSSMTPLAERKGLQLSTEVADSVPPLLCGDPARLRQILANLIDNAIKFTEHGCVMVRACRTADTRWAIEVSDTGPGIPPDALEQIFEAFWQVDGSITRAANRGVGLGLSIVKQLTGLMSGEVIVESQIGHGTTFTVLLPLKALQENPTRHEQLRANH